MDKKVIMLACAGGLSTSMLVTKMQKAALEKDINAEIFAVSTSEAINKIKNNDKIDVILLGPQVKYQEKEFKKQVEGTSIKLAVINMMDYGMMNGDKVLNNAMEMI
ncbi:PTS sugar transporter subunit IIB [Helcococcus kunzii]|uniref:PTS system, lactose/cellobiose family IIB component n=1 Tax=Helcococcus kunzii ATCC 51366 TaxID=883114 RepID=H3NL92_9FIRM|nr:PTS sugar transporter subunit IIB [Helcococcus kunzii]EHR36073.1 PTS system, lactose/cellobiose family IIB component [Helcococcus kunzii ATCC 51366]